MNASNTTRLSLPRGTKIQGKSHKYIAGDIITSSSRSVTVSCKDESGNSYRLKYYNGTTVITEELLKQISSMNINKTVLPVDSGVFNGLCFAVYKHYPVTSTDKTPISINVLVRVIIPQMVNIIHSFHAKRMLIRDLEPSHILFDNKTNRIAFCGTSNFLRIPEKVTLSKAPGYGEPETFISPEIEKFGYGSASDYFAFGMTLLSIVKGTNPAKGLSRSDFIKQLQNGHYPGIDLQHLTSTPYHLYSEEDRVMYLICGLLQPDFRNRWGYGEMNCWLNHQQIPIVQKGSRIAYQFNEPLQIKDTPCWNIAQLVNVTAKSSDMWSNQWAIKLSEFISKQNLSCSNSIAAYVSDNSLSGEGKIFRIIYTLIPSLDKLWWKGESFSDMTSLTVNAQNNHHAKTVLSDLLLNKCLSFLINARTLVKESTQCTASEMREFEILEMSEHGKGVERCIMRFAPNKLKRSFSIDGKAYYSFDDITKSFSSMGQILKVKSQSFLSDQSFQAWLWANGLESVGKNALDIVKNSPEKSFYFLMRLCEKYSKEEPSRRDARNLYLHYGDYAPIVWLTENAHKYEPTSPVFKNIYDCFAKHPIKLDQPLETLVKQCASMITDYQSFVANTHINPFSYEDGDIGRYGIAPKYESCFFCCKWNDELEVCPQFLYSLKETPDQKAITDWLESSKNDENERLNELLGQINHFSITGFSSGEDYRKYCSINQWLSIAMIIIGILLTILSLFRIHEYKIAAIPFGILAVIYPFTAFSWYYRKNVCVSIWMRNKGDSDNTERIITERINQLNTRQSQIQNGIIQKTNSPTNVELLPVVSNNQSDSTVEELNLSSSQRFLAYCSMLAFSLLFGALLEWNSGDVVQLVIKVFFYVLQYGGIAPFIITNQKLINSCKAFAITTICLMLGHLIGFLAFGVQFLIVVDYIPIAIVVAILILCLLGLFL